VLDLQCRYGFGIAVVEKEAPLPRPIDNGQVDQTVVEYTGGRRGGMTYRGPSGRPYRFDASPRDKRKYVLAEDLEYFRCQVDFRVLDETRIDPEAAKLKAMKADIGDRMVKEVTRLLAPKGTGKRKGTQRRRGGRPPVPLQELQRLWHLRHHCLPPWSIEALATGFLGDDYATPHATISTRLSRLKKSHPDLIREDDCPWCAKGYAPDPPARS
jgi:hypothetical protein